MSGSLTSDQRWLLATMGGWPIVWALCGPDGTQHLMASMWGGCGKRVEGAPEWMTSFETRSGKVYSPGFNDQRVVVSAAQIDRFAAQLPAEIKAELQACRLAGIEENQRAERWCYCGRETECHKASGRHHPSATEDQEHLHKVWSIRDWQSAVLAKALGLEGEPVGQLDLFGAAS
jgi:hypothetical protein